MARLLKVTENHPILTRRNKWVLLQLEKGNEIYYLRARDLQIYWLPHFGERKNQISAFTVKDGGLGSCICRPVRGR